MKIFNVTRSLVSFMAQIYLSAIACLTLWILIPMAILWTPTVVISGSMEPLIRTGDVVAAKRLSSDEVHNGSIKVGMVLLADNPLKPGTLFTHRVVEINSDSTFTTKGDANAATDPIHLKPENVKGVEMLRIPYIGLPAVKMREGDTLSLAAMGLSVIIASLIVQRHAARSRRNELENSDSSESLESFSTRAEVKAADLKRREAFKTSYALAASVAAVILVSFITGSAAAFTGQVVQPTNSWVAAASFPAPGPAAVVCGGASYQPSADTSLTCTPGTVNGTTSTYTLTVTGTGPLTQWSVTADWSRVANWYYSKVYGSTVASSSNIYTATGYSIVGSTNSCQTTANCNYGYVSSTKPAVSFTVQVTTK